MTPIQINDVLKTQYAENEKLFEEIMRVKRKSKEKSSPQKNNKLHQSPHK
jgi:hypothetical protein